MLLLTGSEMHNQSNQHDHLMRPPGAYSDGDDDDESEDDFDGVEEGDVEALQAAVGAGEVFHMHDEDEDEDEDMDEDMDEIGLCKLNDDIIFLKEMYTSQSVFVPNYFGNHPTIRNYHNIISKPNYIKQEIGEYIILPTQEAIAILKTFWIRIIQKKWKKVFQERKNIIRKRCYLSNLSFREIRGRWPVSCINFPG